VGSFTIFRRAVAVGWGAFKIFLLWKFPVAMTTPASQKARRLLVVYPDVTEALTIIALDQPFF
jgi:hypothetical protein